MYGFDAAHIGEVIAYMAIPICLSPLLFAILSKHMLPRSATISSALLLSVSILLISLVKGHLALYFLLIPIGLCIAIGWTYSSLIISDRVSPRKQGQALGTNQSITILAEIVAAAVGGIIAGVKIILPLIVAAIIAVCAALWMFCFVKKDVEHSTK